MVVHEWLVVVVFCGDWGVFALLMDFKEVMLTSPPELAYCGGGGKNLFSFIYVFILWSEFIKVICQLKKISSMIENFKLVGI